jgi:pimeloyl-ACP methyl ester carboxylesterase
MSRPDSRPSLGAIHCPTLVLVGKEDALTPVSVALTIADGIAGSKLEIVQECGHLSPMERPDEVTEALRAWINSSARARSTSFSLAQAPHLAEPNRHTLSLGLMM